MPPEALQKLKEKLTAIDNAVTMQELKKAVEAMLRFSVKLQTKTETELKTIAESVKTAISRIETLASNQTTEAKQELQDSCDSMMSDMRFQCEAMISEAQAKIDEVHDGEDGKDGMDADEEKIIAEVLARIPEDPEETPEEVRDLLETLEGDERLDASSIKGLDKYDLALSELKNRPIPSGVAGRGVGVQDEGIDLGLLKIINFTGAGVSVTRIGDTAIVSITGGGVGSTTPIQESGTISNLTNIVTLSQTPVSGTFMLYINEAFVDPSRYSLVGLVVTMGSALDASYSGLRYTAIYQY